MGCVKCNAAADAHFAVGKALQGHLGRKPTLMEVGDVLARAYGDVIGLLTVSGAKEPDITTLNETATRTAQEAVRDVMIASSGGTVQ